MAIPTILRRSLEKRDKNRCAYYLTSEENCGLWMHVDHIIPEVAGEKTALDNLCLVCFACNVYKGAKQTSIDPVTEEFVTLFHPLQQTWQEHFTWNESKTEIVGLTPSGRATVVALQLNNPIVVKARRRWVSAGWHPPP